MANLQCTPSYSQMYHQGYMCPSVATSALDGEKTFSSFLDSIYQSQITDKN